MSNEENQKRLSKIIAPHFYDLYLQLLPDSDTLITEAWLKGGRGSTKSSFISIAIIIGIVKDPEANVIVFRRFENEIRDSVFGQLLWAINTLGWTHLFREQVSPFKITYEPTGQVILFKGADNPKKIKSMAIPTGYRKFAWFEEVDQFGGVEEIRNIIQSIFRGTTKPQTAFFSYNPPKCARSWVNVETKIQKEGRAVHHSDFRTVSKDWLGETFITNAMHLKKTNKAAYEHEYLGLETGTGLEVFKNITLRPISTKEIAQFDRINQGLDFGYAADPLCFEQGHFDAKKKKLYIFFEVSGIGIKNSRFASFLSDDQRSEVTMCDPHEPKTIDELRDEYKVNVIASEAAPGSVEHGTKYLQDLEEIIIDSVRCPLAAKEFINYALNVDRQGQVISKFPDKDNHSIDAIRYMMSLHIKIAKIERRQNKYKTRTLPIANRW